MRVYYLSGGKEKLGPFSYEELKNQDLERKTLVWFAGLKKWKYAKNVPEVLSIIEEKEVNPEKNAPNELIVQTRKKNNSLKKELHELKTKLDRLKTERKKESEKLNGEISKLRSRKGHSSHNKKSNHQGIFITIILVLLIIIFALSNDNSSLEKNKNLTNKVMELETQNSKITYTNNNLKLSNENYKQKIEELKIKNERLNKELLDVKEKIDSITNINENYTQNLQRSQTNSFAPIFWEEKLKDVLILVEPDDFVYIIELVRKGVYKVQYKGKIGYIRTGLLKMSNN